MTGRPTAAPAHFPYDHPNMAVVMRDEVRKRQNKLIADHIRYEPARRSARG